MPVISAVMRQRQDEAWCQTPRGWSPAIEHLPNAEDPGFVPQLGTGKKRLKMDRISVLKIILFKKN